jgi:hypothetical protein
MLSRRTAMFFGLIAVAVAPAFASAPTPAAPVKQQATTAHYRLELQIGPMEKVSSAAAVAAGGSKDGEVLIRGIAATPKDPATGRHVELHVFAIDKATRVTDANVTITLTDAGRKIITLPTAVMYGAAEGPSDTHYGNSVSLPPGNYTVDVTANGEKASFKIAVPAS